MTRLATRQHLTENIASGGVRIDDEARVTLGVTSPAFRAAEATDAPVDAVQARRASAVQPYSLTRTSTSMKPATSRRAGSVAGSIGS